MWRAQDMRKNVGDSDIVKYLVENGPPFLFCCRREEYFPGAMNGESSFVLAGQPFWVSKLATREEFLQRHPDVPLEEIPDDGVFFEATTD